MFLDLLAWVGVVSGPILIVGEAQRRISLVRRVAGLGYPVEVCELGELVDQVRDGAGPSAVMLCAEGPEAADVMQELRGMRRGVSIPVTLCGRLGDTIRDLADVLDLGADQFLEEPFEDAALATTLTAIAGTPMAPPPEPESAATTVSADSPLRTEVLQRGPSADTERHGSSRSKRSHDPSIGRLGRTLDMLEDRLRGRSDSLASDSSDELERSLLGLEPAPAVDVDPSSSGTFSGAMLTDVHRETGEHQAEPMESTLRLEGVSSTHARERDDIVRGDGPGGTLADRSVGRRRRVSLSIERDGDLADLELPRILWSLHRGRYRGRIDIVRGEVTKQIWLSAGELVFARSSDPDDRLVNALVRRGLLTRSQYDAARSLAAKDPRRVGRLLVEAGFLHAERLPEAIRTQVLGIITSMFGWREGHWALVEHDRCDETVLLDEPLAKVVLEGVLDRLDTPELEALVGGRESYVRVSSSVAAESLAYDLGLDAAQRGLLEALDGRRTIGAVCDGSGLAPRAVLATAYGLLVVGAAERMGEPLPVTSDPAALDRARLEERLRMVRDVDYFELLGLPRDANAADVRRHHRELRSAFAEDAIEASVRAQFEAEIEEVLAGLDDAAALLQEDELRLAYLAHLDVP